MDMHSAEALEALAVCRREGLEEGDWAEKQRLVDMHAQELRGMASKLQLETYRRLEAKGRLLCVSARRQDTGELIGY